MPDVETAAEIVKVHSFLPAKFQTSELQTVQIKQNISLQTPVSVSVLCCLPVVDSKLSFF